MKNLSFVYTLMIFLLTACTFGSASYKSIYWQTSFEKAINIKFELVMLLDNSDNNYQEKISDIDRIKSKISELYFYESQNRMSWLKNNEIKINLLLMLQEKINVFLLDWMENEKLEKTKISEHKKNIISLMDDIIFLSTTKRHKDISLKYQIYLDSISILSPNKKIN